MPDRFSSWGYTAQSQETIASGQNFVFSFTVADASRECLLGLFPEATGYVPLECRAGVYFSFGDVYTYHGSARPSSFVGKSRRIHLVRVRINGLTRLLVCLGDTPETSPYGFEIPGALARDTVVTDDGPMRIFAAFPRAGEQIESYSFDGVTFETGGELALAPLQASGNTLADGQTQGVVSFIPLAVTGETTDFVEIPETTYAETALAPLQVFGGLQDISLKGTLTLESPLAFGFTDGTGALASGLAGLQPLQVVGTLVDGMPANRPYFAVTLSVARFTSFLSIDLTETVSASMSTATQLGMSLLERAQVRDTRQTMQTLGVSVSDVCNVLLTARPHFVLSLLEEIEADILQQYIEAVSVDEQVTLADVREALRTRFAEITDTPRVADQSRLAFVSELIEQVEAGLTIDFVQALNLMERARVSDTNAFLRAASLVLGLAAQDLVAPVYAENLYDALDADIEAQTQLRRVAEALDEVQATLAVSGTLVLAINETLNAQAADSVQTLGHYLASIADGVGTWVGVRLGDEQYTGWVMNTEDAMPLSEYIGYHFNSFCRVGDFFYGANDSGLFLLDGPTDDGDPIEASIRTMMLDFGSPVQKRIRNAYFGYTADGKLLLRVRTVDSGVMNEQWYEAQELPAQAPREQMVRLGRGLRSRYWQFELVNIDGADFEIHDMELHPVYLSRRV